MAYEMYMGTILCPVAPSKLQIKIKNQNKTMNLINENEVNVLKSAGLTEISYDLLLPNVKYPFAVYKSDFLNAKVFLDEFEKMKVEKRPFQLKVIRSFPNGKMLFNTDIKVSLEDYTIKEDVKQGFDVMVSIKLKAFRDYGTKICTIIQNGTTTTSSSETVETNETIVSAEDVRETENSPEPKGANQTHTVVKGDCLWNLAKKYYGNGSKYTVIYEANKDKVKSNYIIYVGQVLTIPAL